MKLKNILVIFLVLGTVLLLSMRGQEDYNNEKALQGAWSFTQDGDNYIMLVQDGYCMFTQYNLANKKFILTTGGPYTIENGLLKVQVQFNSADKNSAGKTREYTFIVRENELITNTMDGSISFTWKRIDSGDKHLAGNWRITQRKQGDQMVDIPLRARRTLKLLTATRFQWAAINVETGEFFGTGGGTYSFQDGKYTENIEFFSRDDSRVGMSLTFDGKLDDGKWIHSGKSSKGDPIYEVWERFQDKK